ncbi:MAG: DUF3592 domain-containing protein [Candidatus Roizmanbacteria bacterium]
MNIQKNALSFIGGFFAFIGIIFICVTVWQGSEEMNFLKSASSAKGMVTDVQMVSDDEGSVYHPVVSFKTESNKNIIFQGQVGSNPPEYKTGDTVTVKYEKNSPNNAQIENMINQWFLPGIFGILGTIFASIGLVIVIVQMKKNDNKNWLLTNGQRITTTINSIKEDSSLEVQGNNPFVITSQWNNPTDNVIYIFKSDFIWFDPEVYLSDKKIDVLIEPSNPKKYWMDISRLPKSA